VVEERTEKGKMVEEEGRDVDRSDAVVCLIRIQWREEKEKEKAATTTRRRMK